MSLSRALQQAVNAAFLALGDLVGTAHYTTQQGEPQRDIETGVTTFPDNVTYTLVRCAFVKFAENEVDGKNVLRTDEKLLFPRQMLPQAVEPKAEDTVVDAQNRTWEIKKVMSLPGSAITILQARTTR